MTTLEEIAATETWVKGSDTMDDGEKYRWLTSLAEMKAKELEKTELTPASDTDIEKVMDLLMPEYRNVQLSKEQPKSAEDKFLDEVFKFI